MSGSGWLRGFQDLYQIADAEFAVEQQVKDAQAGAIREGPERQVRIEFSGGGFHVTTQKIRRIWRKRKRSFLSAAVADQDGLKDSGDMWKPVSAGAAMRKKAEIFNLNVTIRSRLCGERVTF